MLRFLLNQYRLSLRAGFTPRKAIARAFNIYTRGF